MQGSIRMVVGLLITMGGVGGIDSVNAGEVALACLIAAAGIAIMASGVRAMNEVA